MPISFSAGNLPHNVPLQTYVRTNSSRHRIDEQFYVETVDSISGLLAFLKDWEELIPCCSTSNVFYEPYFLLTSLQNLQRNSKLRFLFIYRKSSIRDSADKLCGFIPLEAAQIEMYPRSGWKLITNSLSFSCDPLLRAGYENEVMFSFFKWGKAADCSMIELPCVSAEGVFQSAFQHALHELSISPFIVKTSHRACLKRDFAESRERNIRGDINRKRRRLAEQGHLEFRVLSSTHQLGEWQENFLSIEEQGWKGANGTALNQNPGQRTVFRTVTRQAFARNQLQLMSLFLDGKPIAMKCNLLSGKKGYAWKITFDEEFARFSPGLLLEYDFMDYFQNQTELNEIDSCAAPGHPLFSRIWPDQITRQTVYVPTGMFLSKMYCSTRPLVRSLKQTLLAKHS